MDTYYTVLGVSETANDAEIKTAYRKLIREFHPDSVPNASDAWRKIADEKAKEINEAYMNLSKYRATYDGQLASMRPKPQPTPAPKPVNQNHGNCSTRSSQASVKYCNGCGKTSSVSPCATCATKGYRQPYVTPKNTPVWKICAGGLGGFWAFIILCGMMGMFSPDQPTQATATTTAIEDRLKSKYQAKADASCVKAQGPGWVANGVSATHPLGMGCERGHASQAVVTKPESPKSDAPIPAWTPAFGAANIPNAGIRFINKPLKFYGVDYCTSDGYGIPSGELDIPDNRVDDPACKIEKTEAKPQTINVSDILPNTVTWDKDYKNSRPARELWSDFLCKPEGVVLGWIWQGNAGEWNSIVARKLGDKYWQGENLPTHSSEEQAKHEVEQHAKAALCSQ